MQLLLLLGSLSLASALVPQPRDVDVQNAPLLCFYMTVDKDWQGQGINLCQVPGKCSNKLPDGLSGTVSSAGPDDGAICWLYTEEGCRGQQSWPFIYPGFADLGFIGFNDKARSWRCDYR